jgi:hypothetical protein
MVRDAVLCTAPHHEDRELKRTNGVFGGNLPLNLSYNPQHKIDAHSFPLVEGRLPETFGGWSRNGGARGRGTT